MKRLKRLVYYLLINVLVSACTTLAVLVLWQKYSPQPIAISLGAEQTPTPDTSPVSLAETEALPTATPRPLTTYSVKAGDTLGGIAIEYDTTVFELMEINGITDPEELGIGQVLYVPAIATATADSSTEPQLDETTPTPQGSVVIVNVFGVGDLATERVRLAHSRGGSLSLLGWRLEDEDGHEYVFPDLALYPGGVVDLFTQGGANGVVRLYWGQGTAVWQPGELVRLYDAGGEEQAAFTIPE